MTANIWWYVQEETCAHLHLFRKLCDEDLTKLKPFHFGEEFDFKEWEFLLSLHYQEMLFWLFVALDVYVYLELGKHRVNNCCVVLKAQKSFIHLSSPQQEPSCKFDADVDGKTRRNCLENLILSHIC